MNTTGTGHLHAGYRPAHTLPAARVNPQPHTAGRSR